MVLKDLQHVVFCCYTSSLYAAGETSNLVAGHHVTCIITVAVYSYVGQVLLRRLLAIFWLAYLE